MTFTDKLKFWKRDEGLEPLKPMGGFDEPGLGGLDEPGKDFDSGMGKDRTPGLGGTGDIGSEQDMSIPSTGFDGGMQVPGAEHKGIEMTGPSYERPPESGDLRHAPLAPMERPAVSDQARQSLASKDMEIMSAKIDAIKANVESINHRLESIERILMAKENKRYQW